MKFTLFGSLSGWSEYFKIFLNILLTFTSPFYLYAIKSLRMYPLLPSPTNPIVI